MNFLLQPWLVGLSVFSAYKTGDFAKSDRLSSEFSLLPVLCWQFWSCVYFSPLSFRKSQLCLLEYLWRYFFDVTKSPSDDNVQLAWCVYNGTCVSDWEGGGRGKGGWGPGVEPENKQSRESPGMNKEDNSVQEQERQNFYDYVPQRHTP